jgi:hypothetical protein
MQDMQAVSHWPDATFKKGPTRGLPENLGCCKHRQKDIKADIHMKVLYAYEAIAGNEYCLRFGGLTIDLPKPQKKHVVR